MRKIVMLGSLSALTLLAGCNGAKTSAEGAKTLSEPKPVAFKLQKGQPVELMLAKRLDAGACKEGDYAPLVLAEDLLDSSGTVVLTKGAVVDAEVSWSRSEGTLSGVMGQPARLEIRLKPLKIDGTQSVPLTAEAEKTDEPFAFNRSNTGLPGTNSEKLEELLKDEINRQTLEQVAKMFDGEEVDLGSDQAKASLQRIASELGLNETRQLVEKGSSDWQRVGDSVKKLQSGSLLSLATGDGALALGAVMELANLAGDVGGKLADSLKGRTIRAFPGTRLTVYVAEESSGTIKKG